MKQDRKTSLEDSGIITTHHDEINTEINTNQSQFQDEYINAQPNEINTEADKTKGNILNRIKLQKRLDDGRESVMNQMPKTLSDISSQVMDVLKELRRDTSSASGFKKVRAAVKAYFAETRGPYSERAVYNVYRSCKVYLRERSKSSKQSRKESCEKFIRAYESMVEENRGYDEAMKEDHLLELGYEEIGDNHIDAEIRLAYDENMNGQFADVSDKDRRKAFKRKIKECKKINSKKRQLADQAASQNRLLAQTKVKYDLKAPVGATDGYDSETIDQFVKAYMSIYGGTGAAEGEDQLSKDEMTAEMLRALYEGDKNDIKQTKATALETMLTSILTWDLNDFAFDKAEDFANKANLTELINKLSLAENADAMLDELLNLRDGDDLSMHNLDEAQITELRTRIQVLKQVGIEYTDRINLMSSKYYALFLEEDIGAKSYDEITRFIETGSFKATNRVLLNKPDHSPDFLDYLKTLQTRASHRNMASSAGGFKRGKSLNKLKTYYDKQAGVNKKYNKMQKDTDYFGNRSVALYDQLKEQRDDYRVAEEQKKAEEKKKEDDRIAREKQIADEKLAEEKKEEVVEDKKEEIIEDNKELEENKEEQKAEEKVEEIKEEEKPEEIALEDQETLRKKAFIRELKQKADAKSEGSRAWMEDFEREAEKRTREYIAKTLEEERIAEEKRQAELRRQREEELKRVAEAYSKKAKKWSENLDAAETKRIEENIARHIKEDAQALINSLKKSYEALGDEKATAEDARKVRSELLSLVSQSSKRDMAEIGFIPTVLLYKLLSDSIETAGTKEFSKKLSGGIDEILLEFDKSYDICRKPLLALKDKKDLTAAEQQRLYEYSLNVLRLNTDEDEYTYGSMEDMPLSKLISIALNLSDYDEFGPDVNGGEQWSDLSDEKIKKCTHAAASIMTELTGESQELFLLIPASELTEYTTAALNLLLHKDKLKESTERCVARAKQIKDRMDRAEAAIKEGKKAGLLAIINEFTGEDTSLIDDIPIERLREIVKGLSAQAYLDNDSLACECRENVKLIRDSFTKDNLMEKFFELKGRADVLATGGKGDGTEASDAKDYSILYLKKVLAGTGADLTKINEYDGEKLYSLAKNISLIERLREYDDEDSVIGRNAAITDLAKMDISKELKDAAEKLLNTRITVVPVEKETFSELKGVKADKEYKKDKEHFKERVKIPEEKLFSVPFFKEGSLRMKKRPEEYLEHLDKLAEATREKRKKKLVASTKAAASDWNEKEKKVLGFTGDLMEVLVPGQEATKNAAALKEFFRKNKKSLSKEADFIEVEKNLTASERDFLSEIRLITGDAIKKLDEITDANALDAYFTSISQRLETLFNKFEKEVSDKMDLATTDIYDQLEGMGMEPLIGKLDVGDGNKKELAEEGARKLEHMQNELLYDGTKGQGRFMEKLIKGYFKNSTAKNRRFMLSYVVKGMKKNTEGRSESMQGGQYFAGAMMGAGPLMQKMLQGLPERMVVPEMKDTLSVVKSNLRPIDEEYKAKVFEKIKKDSGKKITGIREIKSLGAASVAETYLCEVTGPKLKPMQVVVKVKRPDAMERMESELSFIKECSRLADLTPEEEEALFHSEEVLKKYDLSDEKQKKEHDKKQAELLSLKKTAEEKYNTIGVVRSGFLAQFSAIEKEFDFRTEIANAKRGEKNYIAEKRHVNTVKINSSFKADPDYIVMNLASGQTVDKFIEEKRNNVDEITTIFKNADPKLKSKYAANPRDMGAFNDVIHMLRQNLKEAKQTQEYVADLSYQWFKMAIFGSYSLSINGENFHHGDLHSGNIMVDKKGTTVLDYGNCTILNDDKINEILGMMIAVVANRTDFFVDAFDELLALAEKDDEKLKPSEQVGYTRMTLEQKLKYEEELKKIFALGTGADSGRKVLLALTKAQELGIKLPREIQNFSQCQQRLENSVAEATDLCKDIAKEAESIIRMPVPEEYSETSDPVMQFKRLMAMPGTGEKKYAYSPEKALKKIRERFPIEDIEKSISMVTDINTDAESQKTFKEKFLPAYGEIETDSLATLSGDLLPKLKDAFYKARTYIDKGEKVPEELENILNEGKAKIPVAFLGSEVLSEAGLSNEYVDMASKAFTYNDEVKYPLEAFLKVEYIITEYMPALLNVKKKYDSLVADINKYGIPDDPDDMAAEITSSQAKLTDAVREFTKLQYHHSDEVMILKEKLRGIIDPEKENALDAEIMGMRQADSGTFDRAYDDYKKELKNYHKVLASGDKELIEAEEKAFLAFEKAVIEDYGSVAKKRLDDIEAQIEDVDTAEELDEELTDFNDEIANCLSNHFLRAGKKLGLKYQPEINRMKRLSDEAEKKEKAKKEGKEYVKTQKEIDADKKAEADYNKSIADYTKNRKKMLEEIEKGRIQKAKDRQLALQKAIVEEEPKTKKEEEKRRKEEAKLLEKQKKEQKKAAKKAGKKK